MKYIKWFEEVGIGDVALVGGKNASLGEMIRNLGKNGVNVPSGFAITADAYKYLIEETGIKGKIRDTLADLDTSDMVNLAERGSKIRGMITNAQIPADLEEEIRTAYREMEKRYGEGVDVAVRSWRRRERNWFIKKKEQEQRKRKSQKKIGKGLY